MGIFLQGILMFAHKIIESLNYLETTFDALQGTKYAEQAEIASLSTGLGADAPFSYHGYGKAIKAANKAIKDSPRFYADESPEIDPSKLTADDLRLPFPTTIFLMHPTANVFSHFIDSAREVCLIANEDNGSINIDYVYPDSKHPGHWEIGNWKATIYSENDRILYKLEDQSFAAGFLSNLELIQRKGVKLYADAITADFMGILALLHCNNVFHESVKPPERLNKSRKKKGKVPLLEYKVLKVKNSDGSVTHISGSNGSSGSMRLHRRKGYFGHRWRGHGQDKKLARTWISACVVGRKENGVIIHDYELE